MSTQKDVSNGRTLRLMTYNVHGCVDAQRQVNVERIGDIIRHCNADVIALQEVDDEPPLGGSRNQARTIGEHLGVAVRYMPVENSGRHAYGLAVLSRWPIEHSQFAALPNLFSGLQMRKRGVMRLTLQTPWALIDVINTHLSVFKLERHLQWRALIERTGLAGHGARRPLILCGDLNAQPTSLIYRRLARHLQDVRTTRNRSAALQGTFPAKAPLWCLDHIFVSRHFTPLHAEVIRNNLSVDASDHLPVVADLTLARLG